MSISVDQEHDDVMVLSLARQHALSVYDAAYIEVALRRGLPIASLDRRLGQAAAARHIALFN